MKTTIYAILLTTAFAAAFQVSAQSDWDTYPLREIASLVKQEEGLRSKSAAGDIVISADPFPSKTIVTFLGSKRPVTKYTHDFIGIWAKTRNLKPETADYLVDEYLFKENGIEYWLAVQKSTAAAIDTQLKPGDEIGIYYFYLGGFDPVTLNRKDSTKNKPAIDEKEPFRWVFAVEKFERPRNTAFQLRTLDSLIDKSQEKPGVIQNIWLDARQAKAQAKLKFTGDTRDISGKRKELLELWLENNGFPRGASSLMSTEARFVEGDKEHWNGMRNTTLNEIISNVQKGDSVLLNTILTGGIRTKDGVDWFFVAGQYIR